MLGHGHDVHGASDRPGTNPMVLIPPIPSKCVDLEVTLEKSLQSIDQTTDAGQRVRDRSDDVQSRGGGMHTGPQHTVRPRGKDLPEVFQRALYRFQVPTDPLAES